MSKELKVGDRVKLRGYLQSGMRVDGEKGTVVGVTSTDIRVRGDTWVCEVTVLPSQCARLNRRTLWVNEYTSGLSINCYQSPDDARHCALDGVIAQREFREVLPAKKGGKS